MGLLDKATKLAAAARVQLETAREQLDDPTARREPDPSDDGAGAAPAALDDTLVRRAIANGAPDPATLLSSAQASAAIGHVLGGPNLTHADRAIGVAYESTGPDGELWRVEASSWHGDPERFDAAACFHETIVPRVGGVEVDGLGDQALWDGTRLYVLARDRLIEVATRAPDGTSAEQATAVARCVLANLGD